MKIKLHNNKSIKIQGPMYYFDCYNYWDLNINEHNFRHLYSGPLVGQIGRKGTWDQHNRMMALINLEDHDRQFDNYWDKLSSNVRRDINVAKKNKFYFKKYNFNHHIDDFCEINHSQTKKKSNVNQWYLKREWSTFENAHSGYRHDWEDDLHYSQWYGVFKYFKHYKQRTRTTNEKLFAYCKVGIDGELATVMLIWAHLKHLDQGLMFFLITSLVKELTQFENVRYLQYYVWKQFPKWKTRMLFKPQKVELIL